MFRFLKRSMMKWWWDGHKASSPNLPLVADLIMMQDKILNVCTPSTPSKLQLNFFVNNPNSVTQHVNLTCLKKINKLYVSIYLERFVGITPSSWRHPTQSPAWTSIGPCPPLAASLLISTWVWTARARKQKALCQQLAHERLLLNWFEITHAHAGPEQMLILSNDMIASHWRERESERERQRHNLCSGNQQSSIWH